MSWDAQNPEIIIRLAKIEEIRPLRHLVLRAGLPPEAAVLEGDELPTTIHVGAFLASGDNVGCATLTESEWDGSPAWRLRGMAVRESTRSSGIGRRLLECLEGLAQTSSGAQLIWCNARTPAVPFYVRLGWTAIGGEFHIDTAGPHYRMFKTASRRLVTSREDANLS